MKKILAFFMAFVLFSGIGLPNLTVYQVHAAGPLGLTWLNERSLTDTGEDIYYYDASQPEDEVMLEWNIDKINGATYNTLTHQLQYHLDDSMTNTITVQKHSSPTPYLEVIYHTESHNVAGGVYVDSQPLIYSRTQQDYIAPVIDGMGMFPDFHSNDYYRLIGFDSNGNADPREEYRMVFFVIPDGSFSFKIDNREVKFKWSTSGLEETFQLVTTRALPNATVYDFQLDDITNNYQDAVRVFTGVSEDFLDVQPFDKTGMFYENYWNPGWSPDELISGILVDQTAGQIVTTATDVGIYVSMPQPYAWDASSQTFTQSAYHALENSYTTLTEAQLVMGNQFASVRNFAGNASYTPSPTPYIHDSTMDDQPTPAFVHNTIAFTNTGERIHASDTSVNRTVFIMQDLEPGTIYDTSHITISSYHLTTPGAETAFGNRRLHYQKGTFYTYLRFEITNRNADEFQLAITPYKYSTGERVHGYYRIFKKDGTNPLDLELMDLDAAIRNYLWAERQDTNGDSTIYIPLGISLNDPTTVTGLVESLRVAFRFTDFSIVSTEPILRSQILNYKVDPANLDLGTPQNLKITRSKVVESDDYFDTLIVDMEWDISNAATLHYLVDSGMVTDVDFLFYGTDDPNADKSNKRNWVTLTLTNIGMAVPSTGIYDIGDIVLKAYDPSVHTTIQATMTADGSYNNGHCKVTLYVPVKKAGTASVPEPFFYYPGTFFISLENEYIKTGSSTPKTGLGESLTAVMTLNGLESIEAPLPEGVKAILTPHAAGGGKVIDRSITLIWNTIFPTRYNDYMEYMLNPKKLTMDETSISYNIYISQDMNSLADYSELRQKPSQNATQITSFEGDHITAVSPTILGLVQTATESTVDMSSILPTLRGSAGGYGNVVKIEGLSQLQANVLQTLIQEQLDRNQIYYFTVETVVTPYDPLMSGGSPVTSGGALVVDPSSPRPDKATRSKLSEIVTETTRPDEEEGPDENDFSPPAPTGVDKKDVTLNQATIFWDRFLDLSLSQRQNIGFEILRITDADLSSEERNDKKKTFEETWQYVQGKDEVRSLSGWEITSSDELAGVNFFDGSAFSASPGQSTSTYEYTLTETTHNLTDYTLSPNNLYFYYVRTVRYDGNDKVNYSVWVPVTLTTDPVQDVINLKEERLLSPDRRTKIAVSFDAPIDMRIADVDNNYKLQYSIKVDGEDWQEAVTIDTSTLTITDNNDLEGYTHYNYLIQGLTPGTSYSIRVRLWDTVQNDFSVYSNIVHTRTDYDQETIENEEKTDSWENELRKELEKLMKNPYWKVYESDNTLEAIYRDSMFDAEMAASADGTYILGTGSGNSQIYYISSNSLEKAQNVGKSFGIVDGILTVAVPSSGFDINLTDGLLEAARRIKNNDSMVDYYLKITVRYTETTETVNGSEPLSPRIDIFFDVLGINEQERIFDSTIEVKLLQLIEDTLGSPSLHNSIYQRVSDGVSSEAMVKYIEQIVKDVERDLMSDVRREFASISDRTFNINALEQPILVMMDAGENASVSSYYQSAGEWMTILTLNYGNRKGFSTIYPGTYIFTGSIIEIPGIEHVTGGGDITGIVAKYGLDDIFGKGSNFNLNATCTTYMVVSSLVRISGASKEQNPSEWFKNNGVTISARSLNGNATNQETLYLIMTVYEIKTNTKVSSMKINNHNATANMTGLSDTYKPYVKAAVQMGIITDTKIDAKGGLTVQEFLEMLARFTSKVKL